MADKSRVTRRSFMKTAAVAAAVPMFINSKATLNAIIVTEDATGQGGQIRWTLKVKSALQV
ncbi:MAG: twin-arginine translocation signal domain-containing protein [Phycisphaerae bacterium]|nr:twin-arginine translocation signal domain-containing protein [Phycisphaerae bacterium]MDP7289403.1 twin-arginine translocation signal domain-containing protein [Phycisphaerae bacterium]